MIAQNLQFLLTNLTSGDDEIAEKAVESIAALGEAALPALFDLLDSSNPDSRWWALRTLARISHPEIPPKIWGCLDDPDPAIQQCAALGLSQQPCIDAIPDLIKALNHKDRLLSRLAGDALVAIGGQAVPLLIDSLENGTPVAQVEAARSLALIGDTRAIPALFNAWQEGSPLIQYWAEEGFERMGVGMKFFKPN
jgi:hypothetical protein